MATQFVIAEDNDFFRETIARMLVSRNGLYTCVGEARDGDEVLDLVARRSPDLLILDLRMPRVDGFAVMDALRETASPPRVLVLTMSHAEGMMHKAFAHGAHGYCTKTSGRAALFEAVDRVAAGHRYVSPDLPALD